MLQVNAAPTPGVGALKVCADPYNLPYSNKDGEGFENKIAELFAADLGVPLKYEWFPQRMGFIRNTLKAEGTDGGFKCDLVIGVPDRFELAATTKAYYASTYAFVYAKGRGLDEMKEPKDISKISDEAKQKIRIGAFDRGPGQLWLFKNGLFARMKPYMSQSGDVRVNPINILDDIVADKIDATVIWGPIAGFYAKNSEADLEVIPLPSGKDNPEMKFDYNMSMAVRYGENKWKGAVNELINRNKDKIKAILDDYGIPVVPVKQSAEDND
ncbi:MAG: quinoprotein dehydrogenase-associated putative ABC transporter substrate-binding protein [Gammaproteobacteria bacterium]|nr:quinoprotein dehydrogenase-associated putative ABC transporter substrate-binding protein [Gammaproteobacteria bacterium]